MINNIIIYKRIHFWVKRKHSFSALNIDNSLLNKNKSYEKVITEKDHVQFKVKD